MAIWLCRNRSPYPAGGSAWTVDDRHVERLRCRQRAFDLQLFKALLGRRLIDRWELWRRAVDTAHGPGVDPAFKGLFEELTRAPMVRPPSGPSPAA